MSGCAISARNSDVVPARWAPTRMNDGSCRRPAVAEPDPDGDLRAHRLEAVGHCCACGHDRPSTRAGGGWSSCRSRNASTQSARRRSGRGAVRQRIDVPSRDLEQVETESEVLLAVRDAQLGEDVTAPKPQERRPPGGCASRAPGSDALGGEVQRVEAERHLASKRSQSQSCRTPSSSRPMFQRPQSPCQPPSTTGSPPWRSLERVGRGEQPGSDRLERTAARCRRAAAPRSRCRRAATRWSR